MTNKKSLKEIKQIVELEGLGYSIQHYISANNIKNKELSELWAQAKNFLDEIQAILDPIKLI